MRTDIPILRPDRIRRRHGSFGWIEHRFVREGFLEGLHHPEALLYVFLAIVADERGISFYSQERIRQLLGIPHAHTLQGPSTNSSTAICWRTAPASTKSSTSRLWPVS